MGAECFTGVGIMPDFSPSSPPEDRSLQEQLLESDPVSRRLNELKSGLLVEAAEIETRLRQHVMELIVPTIRRQTLLEAKIKEAKATLESQVIEVAQCKKTNQDAEGKSQMVDNFRLELAKWDAERHAFEQKVASDLVNVASELDALRETLEKRSHDSSSVQRTLGDISGLITDGRAETAELRRYCVERLDTMRDDVFGLRDEFETRTTAVENFARELQDCHTRTSMSISKMQAETERVCHTGELNSEGIDKLWKEKSSVKSLEKSQHEMSELDKHVKGQVREMSQSFERLTSDVNAQIKTAVEFLGTSAATLMEDMKLKYKDETERINRKNQEVEKLVSEQVEGVSAISTHMAQLTERTNESVREMTELVVSSTQKNTATQDLETEVRLSRKLIKDVEDKAREQDHLLRKRDDALCLLLESQLLSAALERQDDQDRKNIALFGFKPDKHEADRGFMLPGLQGTPSSPWRMPRKKMGGDSDQTVVSMDMRCLSCSGSSTTVLAGFKLACLQYAPKPVEYKKTVYTRTDLIHQRTELLHQAKERLRGGVRESQAPVD